MAYPALVPGDKLEDQVNESWPVWVAAAADAVIVDPPAVDAVIVDPPAADAAEVFNVAAVLRRWRWAIRWPFFFFFFSWFRRWFKMVWFGFVC